MTGSLYWPASTNLVAVKPMPMMTYLYILIPKSCGLLLFGGWSTNKIKFSLKLVCFTRMIRLKKMSYFDAFRLDCKKIKVHIYLLDIPSEICFFCMKTHFKDMFLIFSLFIFVLFVVNLQNQMDQSWNVFTTKNRVKIQNTILLLPPPTTTTRVWMPARTCRKPLVTSFWMAANGSLHV